MSLQKKSDEENFAILRKIGKKSELSQREMAKDLGVSLGKLNYCLNELQKKGLVKMRNFKNNKKKINYFYILTQKGLTSKTILDINLREFLIMLSIVIVIFMIGIFPNLFLDPMRLPIKKIIVNYELANGK